MTEREELVKKIVEYAAENTSRQSVFQYPNPQWLLEVYLSSFLDFIRDTSGIDEQWIKNWFDDAAERAGK